MSEIGERWGSQYNHLSLSLSLSAMQVRTSYASATSSACRTRVEVFSLSGHTAARHATCVCCVQEWRSWNRAHAPMVEYASPVELNVLGSTEVILAPNAIGKVFLEW
jgi:hypothetical protein